SSPTCLFPSLIRSKAVASLAKLLWIVPNPTIAANKRVQNFNFIRLKATESGWFRNVCLVWRFKVYEWAKSGLHSCDVNKQAIVKKIIAELVRELEIYVKAADAARAEATHEQSRAENKYDTRGLEASYLARGQSRQASEIEQSIEQFQALDAKRFGANAPIDLGALVEVETKGERSFYFIGPRAGGTEVTHNGKEILV